MPAGRTNEHTIILSLSFSLFQDFIYLFDTQREHKQEEQQGEGEAGSPLSRDPNEGLDSRTPNSRPEPKADTYQLSHPGALINVFSLNIFDTSS